MERIAQRRRRAFAGHATRDQVLEDALGHCTQGGIDERIRQGMLVRAEQNGREQALDPRAVRRLGDARIRELGKDHPRRSKPRLRAQARNHREWWAGVDQTGTLAAVLGYTATASVSLRISASTSSMT